MRNEHLAGGLDNGSYIEIRNERPVILGVAFLKVPEQAPSLTDQHEQSSLGGEVMFVGSHMPCQLIDPFCQNGDLYFS